MGSESWVLIAPGLQSPVPVQVTVPPSVRRAFRAACSRCVIRFDNDIISPNHEGVFLIKCSTGMIHCWQSTWKHAPSWSRSSNSKEVSNPYSWLPGKSSTLVVQGVPCMWRVMKVMVMVMVNECLACSQSSAPPRG